MKPWKYDLEPVTEMTNDENKRAKEDTLIFLNGEPKARVPLDKADETVDKILTELGDGYHRLWSSTAGADGQIWVNREKYRLAIIQWKTSLGTFDANGKEIFNGDLVELNDGFGSYGEASREFMGDGLYFWDRTSSDGWHMKSVKFTGPDVIKKSDVIFKEKF